MDDFILAIHITEPYAKLLTKSVDLHLQQCKSQEDREALETIKIKLKGCLLEYRFHKRD